MELLDVVSVANLVPPPPLRRTQRVGWRRARVGRRGSWAAQRWQGSGRAVRRGRLWPPDLLAAQQQGGGPKAGVAAHKLLQRPLPLTVDA